MNDWVHVGHFEQVALIEVLWALVHGDLGPHGVNVVYKKEDHTAEIWMQRDAKEAWDNRGGKS